MRLESARALKAELSERVLRDAALHRVLPVAAQASACTLPGPNGAVGLGITGEEGNYCLAVRVFRVDSGTRRIVERIHWEARGEVDLRFIGPLFKQGAALRRRARPVFPGLSVGHPRVTAGTLGAVVVRAESHRLLVLSNNHVLAAENAASIGDPVLQPSSLDGGKATRDRIGALEQFVPLGQSGNTLDAAVAALDPEVKADPRIHQSVLIRSVRDSPLRRGEVVHKVGRTTALSQGHIMAFEVDVPVLYDRGELGFQDQIEIVSDERPFSLGGDSGSLIFDEQAAAVGLLFAGNDIDTTYANPIAEVLSKLDIRPLALDGSGAIVAL